MNWFGIEYRDPLFGIIVLFASIFAISFIAYTLKRKKEIKAVSEHQELVKRFELGELDPSEYLELYKKGKLPLNSLILLSNIFSQKGDYGKAISLYLSLLEYTPEQFAKEEILGHLGKIYFTTGLLQRSKEIFLKILKFSPRNKNSLFLLLLTYEKLKDFGNAFDVLESLIELDYNSTNDKPYLYAQSIASNSTFSNEKKIEKLSKFFDKNRIVSRLFASFLIINDIEFFWKNFEKFDLESLIDILWYMPKAGIDFEKFEKNRFLNDLYSAKGYLQTSKSSEMFELDILILNRIRENKKSDIDLNFEYHCKVCKKVNFVYEGRCPFCHSALSLRPVSKITKVNFEKNNSFQ